MKPATTHSSSAARKTLQLLLSLLLIATSYADAESNKKDTKKKKKSITPGDLLIFYGIPSLINGCASDIDCAAAELSRYDYIVLGDGLQLDTSIYINETKAVLGNSALDETTVFGYVDLGVTKQNLTIAQVESRVDDWVDIGAEGIFFDDFGYDFETSRARQNEAVFYVHSTYSLPVMANGFRPDDVLGDEVDAVFNPSGTPTELGTDDFYLYESYQIILDEYVDQETWRAKADQLKGYRNELDIGIMSITTTQINCTAIPCPYNQEQFFYTWWSALLEEHEATGWGEQFFGSSFSLSEFRERPTEDPGKKFLFSSLLNDTTVWERETNAGTVFVDTRHPPPNDHYGIRESKFLDYCYDSMAIQRVFRGLRLKPLFAPKKCQTISSLFSSCSCP